MFIEDYMTADPRTVRGEATVVEAHELMLSLGVRHLPVVDEGQRLTGIISDRDVRSAAGYNGKLGTTLAVAEIMTADPITISCAASLDDALSVFHTKRIGALPVMRSERLAGIVTRSDLLRAFFEVLGLDECGRRVEVALPNGYDDVAHAFAALTKCERSIISAVVSRMRRDGGEPSLYLRVSGTDTREVERQLRDVAAIVLEPEHT